MDLERLSDKEKMRLLGVIQAKQEYIKYNKIDTMLPSAGPCSRDKYRLLLEFYAAGKTYNQRVLLAGNRIGKTEGVAFELVLHATGEYPDWWEGRRYTRPVTVWAASDVPDTLKAGIQTKLLGDPEHGTGLLRKSKISKCIPNRQVTGLMKEIHVPHASGGTSVIVLKTYSQDRKAFQAATVDIIWFDEEPPNASVYAEAHTRVATTKGMVLCSFTPLSGFSEVVQLFVPDANFPLSRSRAENNKWVTNVAMDDVPHLDAATIDELLSGYPIHERDARRKGLPAMGAGLIYAGHVPTGDITVEPFQIPNHWPRGFGLDFGYQVTAAVFYALDPATGIYYQYGEYCGIQKDIDTNARALLAIGANWLTGACDPAGRGRNISDGERTLDMYLNAGLDLVLANNDVQSGIDRCLRLYIDGKIKKFRTCTNALSEYGVYVWDKDRPGHVKRGQKDHFMDADKYFFATGTDHMRSVAERDSYKDFYADTWAKTPEWGK